jgi:formiminotetrahydrofolate cyclodeaminase
MSIDSPVERFLDELASAAPTPGGGSAAAVIGAMGAALLSMVCNVTLGKKGQESVADEMRAVREETERLRLRLAGMLAQDVAAFDALMRAYRLPKGSEAEKAARQQAIQSTLRGATEAPLDCARACAELIGIARRAAEGGFSGVISDAGVGVLAAQTALRSAALNVQINVPNLEDQGYAAAAREEIERLVSFGALESEQVFALVRNRIG